MSFRFLIGNYVWRSVFLFSTTYNGAPGSFQNSIGNNDLTWEQNKPFDVGLEAGLFNDRIYIEADYYNRKTENLLLNEPLSGTGGFTTYSNNVGAMENKGFEVTINATPVKSKNFNWTVSLNAAWNKNKVTQLRPGVDEIIGNPFTLKVGADVQSYYLRQWAGADPANGDPLWYTDATHAAKTNIYPPASARTTLGNALPKYFGGFTNNFTFKGFTLEAQLYYNFGNYVYDTWGGYYLGSGFGATFNKVSRVLDRWQKPGDVTDIPKYIYNGNKNFQSGSTFWLNQGDFVRLRNLQLGYNVPKNLLSKIKLTNAFVYVRGTNLWTWVKDDNLPFDPEQGSTSASNLNVFIPKTITAGLNLSF